MKSIPLFLLIFFLLNSCARQKVYEKYPDCIDYFNFLEKSWNKKESGYFVVNEIPDSTKPVWAKYAEPPEFQQQWDRYSGRCLCSLTEKEVRAIFGKPTIEKETFQHIKKITTVAYSYRIAYDDHERCDEDIQKKAKLNICSFMRFTFWEGKQDRRFTSWPRLKLINRYQ